MFEKIIEENGLRKLNKIGRDLLGTVVMLPTGNEIVEGTKELERRLNGNGRVNKTYTKNVIIAYNYADTHFHYKRRVSLLDDINNDKKIYINSYI